MFNISALIKNPIVKAAFERAERDNGAASAITAPTAPVWLPIRRLQGVGSYRRDQRCRSNQGSGASGISHPW